MARFTPPKGLTDTSGNHALVSILTVPRRHGGDEEQYTCKCGTEWRYRPKADGKPSLYMLRSWQGHLEADREQGTILTLGTVQKPRLLETVTVLPIALAVAGDYSVNRWQRDMPWAMALVKTNAKGTVSSSRVMNGTREKTSAIEVGNDYLVARQLEGYTVTFDRVVDVEETVNDVTFRLMEVTDRALETGDLQDIEVAHLEMQTFYRLLPIIEAKRDALVVLRNNKLGVTA